MRSGRTFSPRYPIPKPLPSGKGLRRRSGGVGLQALSAFGLRSISDSTSRAQIPALRCTGRPKSALRAQNRHSRCTDTHTWVFVSACVFFGRRDTAEPFWCPDSPLSGCNSHYSGSMIIFVFVKSRFPGRYSLLKIRYIYTSKTISLL